MEKERPEMKIGPLLVRWEPWTAPRVITLPSSSQTDPIAGDRHGHRLGGLGLADDVDDEQRDPNSRDCGANTVADVGIAGVVDHVSLVCVELVRLDSVDAHSTVMFRRCRDAKNHTTASGKYASGNASDACPSQHMAGLGRFRWR